MNRINDGGRAFPQPNHLIETDRGKEEARAWLQESGMTLRDWFAGQAMSARHDLYLTRDLMAKDCYSFADAMIAAREDKP